MAPLLPSTRLLACPACREHVKSSDGTCPHCGAELRGEGWVTRAAGAALVGLALTGCPDDNKTSATSIEPEYGVATSGMTTAGTDSSGGSTAQTSVEPEYGVPQTSSATGTGPEPEYGVPQTTTDASTGGSSSSSGSTGGTGPEPDYGVPGTTG